MRKKGCIADWLICRISGNIKTFKKRITKKIILVLLFFFVAFTFAQEKTSGEHIVYDNVEKLPEFPGGIDEFRTLIMKNFRTDKIKMARGVIKSTVNFNIGKDGSSVDVKAIFGNKAFNDKAFRGVSEIKEKWVAALLDNKAVISRFRMPLKMSFE